ncbi:MAG: ORF6N domain-containing protein [Treponema sp.]|nr:ORF6N domain-containing protein [Treponema sp.]
MEENNTIPIQDIIYEIRGLKVMLDSDLARLYEIETKALNRAVKRNIERFPDFFMFQLTENEFNSLRCQIGTSNESKGGRRYLPYVFTEHGVLMLSSVLSSKKAINVNIEIMVTFIKMRQYVLSQTSSNEQISELYKLLMLHIDNCDFKFSEHDKSINQIIKALNNLIEKPKPTGKIGFNPD